MRQVASYNCHDIVRFQVAGGGGAGLKWGADFRFSPFRADGVERPDICLNVGRFTPANDHCCLVDHRYYVKEDYFYCRDAEGAASWEVEIAGFEGGAITMNLDLGRRFTARPGALVSTPVLLPLSFMLRAIEHRLGMEGYLLSHSAAVAREGRAYLLSGRSGCFKTSLCMDLVRRAGYGLLGDDRVILGGDRAWAFPLNRALFDFMAQRLPDETHLGPLQKAQFVAHYLRGGRGGADGVGPAQVGAVLLLGRGQGPDVVFQPLPADSLPGVVAGLLVSNRLEAFAGMGMPGFGISSAPFLRYMLAYSFVFPRSPVATMERGLAQGLEEALRGIPLYRVEVPPRYGPEVSHQVQRFMEGICP